MSDAHTELLARMVTLDSFLTMADYDLAAGDFVGMPFLASFYLLISFYTSYKLLQP